MVPTKGNVRGFSALEAGETGELRPIVFQQTSLGGSKYEVHRRITVAAFLWGVVVASEKSDVMPTNSDIPVRVAIREKVVIATVGTLLFTFAKNTHVDVAVVFQHVGTANWALGVVKP
jgi:hypothetical protein